MGRFQEQDMEEFSVAARGKGTGYIKNLYGFTGWRGIGICRD